MSLISILHLAYGEMGAPVLKSLINDQRYDVVGIVTPPIDADLYRQASFLPQEQVAHDHKINIFKTDKLSKIHELVANLSPDLVLIASFNKLIPEPTLNSSKFINIHHGKLPRQRGRANINWAIINGEPSVSVSIHEAVAELDAGNILRQYHFTITPASDVADMYRQINETLFAELPDLLAEYLDGRVSLHVQDQSRATFYCTRLPEDGMIDWTWPAAKVINLIRALRKPFPGAFTYLGDQKLTIWDAREPDDRRVFEGIVPGRVVGIKKGLGVEVLAGDGPLLLTDVEGLGKCGDPSQLITTSKCTLGLTVQYLLERLNQRGM